MKFTLWEDKGKSMNPIQWLKVGGAALLLIFVMWGLNRVHENIQQSGRDEIQALWDADKEAHRVAIEKLKAEYMVKEEAHRTENRRISSELSKANLDHANALAAVAIDYAERLRTSETRANIYQRQAQGGAAERRGLADHASRLDASLEEGRSLVRELRETLGLRDRQIQSLSKQIENDRALFADKSGK